jgi:hypothetical protein
MTSSARPMGRVGDRLRLAVAGAAVATVLTAAAAAAAPTTMGGQAPAVSRAGASTSRDTSARGPVPGFLLERGRFKPVALPPGLEDLTLRGIAPIDLNNRGQITGLTGDPTAPVGFLLDRGRLTTFSVPGVQATIPYGINDQGQIAGTSVTGTTGSGFLRDTRWRLTAINRPGFASTVVFDINNRGQIVGVAVNPEDLPSPPPTDPAPMSRMT